MGVFHRATRAPLGLSRRFADLFRHQLLEPRRRHSVARLVDTRIRVQPVVNHDPVDEIIDDRSNVVDAAESVVQRRLAVFPRSPPLASSSTLANAIGRSQVSPANSA
jgi:hypothetical protein